MRPLTMLALAAVAALAGAGPAAAAPDIAGYDGSNPFRCELQQAGKGTEVPRPGADPLCVEYDKTHQNVTEGGIVEFLAGEPARFAMAGDKCFYYQHDHWRSSVEQGWEQTEVYNWDGGYFLDRARGVGGVYVENFTLFNLVFDVSVLPGFPDRYQPFFGPGRGGLQLTGGVPIEPRCVEKAEREDVYREGEGEGLPGDGDVGSDRKGTARKRRSGRPGTAKAGRRQAAGRNRRGR